MEHIDVILSAAKLVQADIISGYIPNEPVMDNRDELINIRINFYTNLLSPIIKEVYEKHDDINKEKKIELFNSAIELVNSEISCLYISLQPVLYDRDEMISERIKYYFNQLITLT